ncbi:MAG: phosphotransferase [Methylococcaceae bacterium]|nr:phosphotransferase [Methylococcaceae bacterium]
MTSGNKSLAQHQFAYLIPHAGRMILIDSVDSWTSQQIVCRTRTHLMHDNPLRLNGQLSALHLIEYGAQSTAIHGGLLTGQAAPGFLAAVRGVHFYIDTLDEVTNDLVITASAELKISNGAVYAIRIRDADDTLLFDARTTVVNL